MRSTRFRIQLRTGLVLVAILAILLSFTNSIGEGRGGARYSSRIHPLRTHGERTNGGSCDAFRFSIASMMAAILIIALSFAALRINSVFCGGIILLTTLALLCRAIFMSLAESGPSRLAWICGRVAAIPPVEPVGADSGLRRDGVHLGILPCRQT